MSPSLPMIPIINNSNKNLHLQNQQYFLTTAVKNSNNHHCVSDKLPQIDIAIENYEIATESKTNIQQPMPQITGNTPTLSSKNSHTLPLNQPIPAQQPIPTIA